MKTTPGHRALPQALCEAQPQAQVLGIEAQFHPEPACFKSHAVIQVEAVHRPLSRGGPSLESEGRGIPLPGSKRKKKSKRDFVVW
jgi:hypothetical protein